MTSDEDGGRAPAGAGRTPRIRPEILRKMADLPLRRDIQQRPEPVRAVLDPTCNPGMAATRARLPVIAFLDPEAVPDAEEVARALPSALRDLCIAALDSSPEARAAALAALTARTRDKASRTRRSLEAMIAADMPSNQDSHDIFFNIRRVIKPDPAVYIRSLLETLEAFRHDLAETPVTVAIPVLESVETGLLTAAAHALGAGARRSPGHFPVAPAPAFADYSERRWIRGHQIFAALNQELAIAMKGLKADAAVAGGQAISRVVTAIDSCAAALQFTGNFAQPLYDTLIRPSMCQPAMPRGFSGLLSADHMHLVRSIKEMKTDLEALRASDPNGHAEIAAAMGRVYDSHKYVCEKFVGTERSSLLMTEGSGRSSVEQLERFKAMRVRSLG